MTPDAIVARARSAIGLGIAYSMGSGAHDPSALTPAGDDGACDCSGYVCWVLGTRRYRPDLPELQALRREWLNTDSIWILATTSGGLFVAGPATFGGVVVYPSARTSRDPHGPHVGHIGIVSEVANGQATRVIHCSHGNMDRTGDAVAETGPQVFMRWESTLCAAYEPGP